VTSQHYAVVHETRYEYEEPVTVSRQVVRMSPRKVPWQMCIGHRLDVLPTPEALAMGEDAFGNPIGSFSIETDHSSLSVVSESHVEVTTRDLPDDAATPAWEDVKSRLSYRAGRKPLDVDLDATRYLFESARVRNKRELAAWAIECFPPRTPLLTGVRTLMNRIHDDFKFDPKATTVSTPVMEVFEKRAGVCQDFAHLMLSCLRSLGLAARYVSGYLLTRPPPGKKRLIGADASHAWLSVYCPEVGWVDVDPTNRLFPSLEHVTVAWGRDYDDVIPLRGVLLGGGAHSLNIKVTVAPVEEYESLFGKPMPF
jgi:transglutaminase-like putative cysteine protease